MWAPLEGVSPLVVPIGVLEARVRVHLALMRVARTDGGSTSPARARGQRLEPRAREAPPTGGAADRMLSRAGFDGRPPRTALTAVGLLSTATLFVLPDGGRRYVRAGGELRAAPRRDPRRVLADLPARRRSMLLTSDRVSAASGTLLRLDRCTACRDGPRRCRAWPSACVESRNVVRSSLSRVVEARSRRRSATSSSTSWPWR